MDSILRGAATYCFIWLIFRVSGKRTLADITTFDALLLLIISECVQGALVSNDSSMTNSFLLVMTMVGIDIVLSCLKRSYPAMSRVLDGSPVILWDRHGPRREVMSEERVDEEDILAAARAHRGLAAMSEVEYAILEEGGGISIIPKRS